MIAAFAAQLVRLACGCRPRFGAPLPDTPVVIIANHSSHLDGVIVWASLPAARRTRTRLVGARDYWDAGPLRRLVAQRGLNVLMIERAAVSRANNPLTPMLAALEAGESLILFPEGTRGGGDQLGEFRAGIHHLARKRPGLPLVPARLDNLNRILPKGEWLPLPLIGAVQFGRPLQLAPDEDKATFLARLRKAIEELGPHGPVE